MKTQPVSEEEFDKLSMQERRIAIVKDALAQLESGRYTPSPGRWCQFDKPVPTDTSYGVDTQVPLQPILNESKCYVCGLGALFASAVGLYNECHISMWNPTIYWGEVEPVVCRHFNVRQVHAVEIAFEKGGGSYKWHEGQGDGNSAVAPDIAELYDRALRFGRVEERRNQAHIRLKDILQNMIDNNGEFKP